MPNITNFDRLDAPCLEYSDLPENMGPKIEVGDTIIAKKGPDEQSAEVIEIDRNKGIVYLTKELDKDAHFIVKETATGNTTKYAAIKKAAQDKKDSDSKKVADAIAAPLPDLKKVLIQISVNPEG